MMELTASEIALIEQRRAQQATEKARMAFKSKAIATAHEFEVWSEESGEDLTFSTFINAFGYQDDDGNQMYEAVKRIRQAAWPQ